MKNSCAAVAVSMTVGLVFMSGCERATGPETNGASRELSARANEGTSLTTALPDLTLDADRLQSSILIVSQKFRASSCAVVEGCVDGSGKRKLLKFDILIANRGTADLILGTPANPGTENLFEFSPCHGHYHLDDFVVYELLNSEGTTVRTGDLQAFCLEDSLQLDVTAGPEFYTCGDQGIQVGWATLYSGSLDCQCIDITNVEPGEYRLRITINATPSASPNLTESDYSNNTAEVPVTIPGAKKAKPA